MSRFRSAPRDLAPVMVSALPGAGTGRAAAEQSHLQAALPRLQAAQADLDVTTADKGGHRVKAQRQVGKAGASARAGIALDHVH